MNRHCADIKGGIGKDKKKGEEKVKLLGILREKRGDWRTAAARYVKWPCAICGRHRNVLHGKLYDHFVTHMLAMEKYLGKKLKMR